MITRQQISQVLDHPVYDVEGNKVGDARHVFLDDATGEPEWVSVKTGMFGMNESFVPIRDATLVADHLEVPYPKGKIKDAPNIDVDAGGHMSEAQEQRLYEYYGIAWDNAWERANQPGEGGWASTQAQTGTGMAGEPTGMAGESAGRAMGTAGTAAGTASQDDAMTRSEEQLHVDTERREVGRARLRKYVVTEQQQMTVPVRKEQVRVEREPITDANRDAAMRGAEITESEHEVILHEERPVVETEVVPVERVRLATDERTEEETVSGEVRKERIEQDTPDQTG